MEKVYSLNELDQTAIEIIQNFKHKTILLNGEMGAGKTTLISKIINLLGSKDTVSSPTFSIINQYQLKDNQMVNHFDFYRIKSQHEALDIGVEEYFYSNDYNFIEWSEKIPDLLPPYFTTITIVKIDENTRKLIINQ
ncbi:MAG: tRNA (adenosine(37)-N6)-threonylcarbamoyltransferase complex ATPase subunit type 1 TsaE [Flavobacterium sp.]